MKPEPQHLEKIEEKYDKKYKEEDQEDEETDREMPKIFYREYTDHYNPYNNY